ncbi:MAG: SpoIID/LytB domain-containing protein [Clostridiales bacterium]|jgi:stage II sporulation protein D|nr:SpoIID/LytB domain-containing protein [Clostridiales bacterium]
MKKVILTICILFSALIISAASMPSPTGNNYVNVGLESKYKNIASVAVDNSSINIFFGGQQVGLQSSNGFSVSQQAGYYLKSDKAYRNYDEANNNLINYGTNSVAGFYSNNFYIFIGPFDSMESAQGALESGFLVEQPNKALVLISGSENAALIDSSLDTKISPANREGISLSGAMYRGAIKFAAGSRGLTVINYLPVEEYLYSTLPSEMPPSWHEEALKAQAVAARSYVYTRAGIHSNAGYDVCDTVHCQAYNGMKSETDKTNKAVADTKGIIAYYDGEPINAVFSSSSGGITDDSENTWSSSVPYLKSVLEVSEDSEVWSRSFNMGDITTLLNKTNSKIGEAVGVSIDSIKNERVHELAIHGTNGKKVLTGEEIRTFFSSSRGGSLHSRYFRINEDVPKIQAVKDQSLPSSPQQSPAYYIYDYGDIIKRDMDKLYVYNGNTAQMAGGDIVAIGKNGTLPPVNNPTNSTENTTYVPSNETSIGEVYSGEITLNGRGWGHGVGMSQYGAQGMALEGYSYDQIIKHYFSGVDVK